MDLHDAIYQTKWYLYPVKEQRSIQLVLLRLQRPIILTGYGFVSCTLKNFVEVLRTVGSVLAVFQSLNGDQEIRIRME